MNAQNVNKLKYLRGRERQKIVEMEAHMRQSESIDRLAWILMVICIILFVLFGGL